MSGTDTTTPPPTDGSAAPSSSATETPNTSPASAPATPTDSPSPSSGVDSKSPSSGDTPRSDREGLLAAVRSVLPPKPEPDAATVAEADGAGAGTDRAGAPGGRDPSPTETRQTEEADPSEGELRRLKPETRRRFERLLSQRDEARNALAGVQPDLDQHRQLQGYLQQHQLAPDDVNMLLGVGAALRRGDFKGFLDGVTPYVMAAQEALGVRIAPDLQGQVDEGLVSEDAARELTRTRHRAIQAEHQAAQHAQARSQDQQDHAVQVVRGAIEAWEDGIRKRDPDYPIKSVAVRRFSQALLQERGVPRTPAEAVSLAQAAYDEATREFARVRPAPQATRLAPSGIQGTTGGVAEPKSMKEAALMALENMRRAS